MVDTIVALSSPPGTAGLAVVRLSGSRCREVVEKYLSRREMIPRHVYYGAFRDAEIIVDRLNFVLFPGPGSSTGEDVLELFPHGNMLIVENILRAVLKIDGVRLAEAGEFTRRSFENGKVDLLQAEAVGELIHAQTAEALKNAQKIVGGALSVPLKALRESLLDMSARLELDVDFSEEEADPDYSSWLPRMQKVFSALEKLANSFERGRGLARAPRVAILGAPNAGKSSLINALIEEDRLLVSNIPGTTRDYIDVPLRLAGGMIYLVDTAGLGKPVDGLDELAMARTRQQWQAADYKIWIEDGTKAEEKTGRNSEGNVDVTGNASVTGAPNFEGGEEDFSLRVLTKFDLPEFIRRDGFLKVSSKSGEGLKEFRARLNAEVFSKVGSGEDPVLTTERQFQSIAAASERVKVALEQLQKKPAIEIIAFEIREAVNHLKGLLGEISSDEVLQKVFSGYCIGK